MNRLELLVSEALEILYFVLKKRPDQFLTFSELVSIAKHEVLGFEMCYSPTYNGILQQRLAELKGVYKLFNFDMWNWMYTEKDIPKYWDWPKPLVDQMFEWAKSTEAKKFELKNLPRPEIIHLIDLVIEKKQPKIKFSFPLSIQVEYLGSTSWYWDLVLGEDPKLEKI